MPIAKAEVEKIAIAESPFIRLLSLSLSKINAEATTTGKANFIGAKFITAATDNAPYPT